MTSILAAAWALPIANPPIRHGAIAIDAGQIAAVASLDELRRQFPHAAVRQFSGAALLPGLVNVHTHLELTLFRGTLETPNFPQWISELVRRKREEHSREDLFESARLGCQEAIRSGITTIADTAESDVVLPALIESGLRGTVYQECFGPDPGAAHESIRELTAKVDAMSERPERIRVGISPHAPYTVSADLYRAAAMLARERNLDLAMHVAESPDERALLEKGEGGFAESLEKRGISWSPPRSSTIRYLDGIGLLASGPLLIHCVDADLEDFKLMARNRARFAHCPKSNAKFGHGIARLLAAREANVTTGLGSDSVASNNTCDLIEEARFCALLHRAVHRDGSLLTAREMLKMITLDGARALRIESEIGSLEVGKQADMIAIDLKGVEDPETAIIFSSSRSDVLFTMVEGKVLWSRV
jgi:cytosine/adenosine deaminase-related metal-dependent hydrolase